VEIDRPAMGEELRLDGEETVPRQAATVILLIVAMVMCTDVISSRIRRAAI